MHKKDINKLLSPDSALENYFDNLLQASEMEKPASAPLKINDNLLLLSDLESELSDIESLDEQQEKQDPVEDQPQQTQNKTFAEEELKLEAKTHAASPARYHFPLQCLMFKVNDIQLALPLIDMLTVVSHVKTLTRLPQRPDWLAGLLTHRDMNVRVVRLDCLLSISVGETSICDQHVLILKDGEWGITCDQLGKVIELQEEDLKWSGSSCTGYALGTIKNNLTMVLDLEKVLRGVSMGG
jgi:purine-binding chemotaxis protein CheW